MDNPFAFITSAHFLFSMIVLAAAAVIFSLHKKIIERFKNNSLIQEVFINKSSKLHFVSLIINGAYWFLVIASVLQINGINIGSLITGLGIVGIIVGFALQDMLKDFMMGVDIITDSFFSVGDVIRYVGVDGRPVKAIVESFNMKVTKLYDFQTGSHFTVCNRNISEIEVLSDWLDIQVPASYDVDREVMDAVCEKICEKAQTFEEVNGAVFLGTSEFTDSTIIYLIRLYCPQPKQAAASRKANALIQDVYKANRLSIPYPQLDAHLYAEKIAAK